MEQGGDSPGTVIAWCLQIHLVRLRIHDSLQLDDAGVWTTPDGIAKVCWFKDPDGNILSLAQFP